MYVCMCTSQFRPISMPAPGGKQGEKATGEPQRMAQLEGENDQETETVFEEYSDDELQPSPGPWTPSHNYTWEALPVGAGGRTVWIPRPNVVIVSRLAYRDRFAAKVAFARHSVLSPALIENITAFLLW